QWLPRPAAVDRFENAAVRPIPGTVFPRTFPRFPERRVNDLRIGRIDLHVGSAGIFILAERFLERLPAVSRKINAALFVRPVRMTCDSDKQPIRILWVNRDRGNLLALAQAEVGPRLSRVGRFVNAV